MTKLDSDWMENMLLKVKVVTTTFPSFNFKGQWKYWILVFLCCAQFHKFRTNYVQYVMLRVLGMQNDLWAIPVVSVYHCQLCKTCSISIFAGRILASDVGNLRSIPHVYSGSMAPRWDVPFMYAQGSTQITILAWPSGNFFLTSPEFSRQWNLPWKYEFRHSGVTVRQVLCGSPQVPRHKQVAWHTQVATAQTNSHGTNANRHGGSDSMARSPNQCHSLEFRRCNFDNDTFLERLRFRCTETLQK